ncbi:MAG: tetratricopeptide repeat protein [Candidatus Omnitrophota bacterium]
MKKNNFGDSAYQFNTKDITFVLIILVLAMVFRVIYFADYKNASTYPVLARSDSHSYYVLAKDISSGDVFGGKAFMTWPLYAYFLGFLFKFFGDSPMHVYFLQFILGAIHCVLVYLIAKIVFNQKVAFISGLLCVWYGMFIFYDGLFMYTSLSIFLNSLLFLLMLYVKNAPSKKNLFFIGLFTGLCALAQPLIVLFGVSSVAAIAMIAKLNWRARVYNFSCFILGMCLVVGVTTLKNYVVEKDFILLSGNTGFNFYLGNNSESTGNFFCPNNFNLNKEDMFRDAKIFANAQTGKNLKTSEVSRFWFTKATEFIKKSPYLWVKLLCKKMIYAFSPREFNQEVEYYFIADTMRIFKIMLMDLRIILPLGLLGMLVCLKKFKQVWLLYLMLITIACSMSLFFVITKLRIAMAPFLIIFAAFCIYRMGSLLKSKKYLGLGLLCVGAIALGILLNRDKIFAGNTNPDSQSVRSLVEERLYEAAYYEHKSDYNKAIQELDTAHDLQPRNTYVLFHLGLAYYRMNDFKKAEERFKETIELNPLFVDAYYNLGFMYNHQQRFSEAKDMLNKALSLEPESVDTHFELALVYKATGNLKEAREEFALVLRALARWRKAERDMVIQALHSLDG